LATKDHFSSNWTSRVLGGKSHELVVEFLGLLARQKAKAHHRILIHADQTAGLPHPTAFRNVLEQRHDLVLGQATVEQRRSFPLGKAGLAGAAAQQASLLRAIAPRHGQVTVPAFAMIRTSGILATELAQVLQGSPSVARFRYRPEADLLQERPKGTNWPSNVQC
jgi:hypothetical protein